MRKYPGGSWPDKTDKMIAKIAAEKGQPKPAYVQIVGSDLEILRLAVKTRRMPGITWDRGAHMVSLVHAPEQPGG